MKDQHEMIKGYRDLSQEEIDLINQIKHMGEHIGALIEKLESIDPVDSGFKTCVDGRWVSIGKTHLQQGIMALVRSIAQPESF